MEEVNIRILPEGVVLHSHRIPMPGAARKIIYHFSDTHLALSDALSSEEEIRKARETNASWLETRAWFANRYAQHNTQSQQLDARTHFENLLRRSCADGDGVVLCGDIFDHMSPANLRYFHRTMESLPIPALALCGNHEDAAQFRGRGPGEPVQLLDLGDLVILGLDNSRREITGEQNRALTEALEKGKPLIIAMHIPIMTGQNRELLLSCGEYFRLNHPEATEETLKFIDILKANPGRILAVLAGHLHFANQSEIAPGLTQYVSSQGILGNLHRYEIGE